jgi:hypothetical protein
MLNFIKERLELWKFRRTPIAQAIRAHTDEYFSLPSLSRTTDENRERIVADFCQKLGWIYSSPDPALACRERLAEYALLFAKLQVLALTEPEKATAFYSENPLHIWAVVATYSGRLRPPRRACALEVGGP